jgi:hypothetical protein
MLRRMYASCSLDTATLSLLHASPPPPHQVMTEQSHMRDGQHPHVADAVTSSGTPVTIILYVSD